MTTQTPEMPEEASEEKPTSPGAVNGDGQEPRGEPGEKPGEEPGEEPGEAPGEAGAGPEEENTLADDVPPGDSEDPVTQDGSGGELGVNAEEGDGAAEAPGTDGKGPDPGEVGGVRVEAEADADSSTDEEDSIGEEEEELLQQLGEERRRALHANGQLQTRLVDFLSKTSWDSGQQEAEVAAPESEQLREYEEHVEILSGVRRQLAADAEAAQLVAEELRAEYEEMSQEVEREWQEHLVELSHCMAKHAPQAQVDATLALEQVRQEKLIKLRVEHIKLRWRVQRMEAALRKGGAQGMDRLQLQFEYVLAARRRQKKDIEKQYDEGMRLQGKINGSLELLSNIKEKLFWSQAQVQSRRKELAELEATLIESKDVLTATKRRVGRLQRDNVRMKECRGLLGHTDLLGDFEDAVDGAERLEEHLKGLMSFRAKLRLGCRARSNKKLSG